MADMTLEQARDNLVAVLGEVRNPPLNRAESNIVFNSVNVLYSGAKDNEESMMKEPDNG